MKNITLALLCLLVLGACSRNDAEIGFSQSERAHAAPKETRARSMLAYEHSIDIETGAAQVPGLFEAAQQICLANAGEGCVVLESHINAGDRINSTLKFRAKGAVIARIVDALSRQGAVQNRSTIAEDLGGPIEDGARKLQMLKDYRGKLEALQARASLDVDSLIKLTRELADVQSQLEALAGNQAKLVQRVDTEILNVEIHAAGHSSAWHPIRQALSGFGENLAQGGANAITATAFLLPWTLLLAVLGWGLRKIRGTWRQSRKRVAAGAS
jgi:hypothetical protein